MTRDELIDIIGEQIFWYDGGMDPQEKLEAGDKIPHWKQRYPFESREPLIEQHLKDEYLFVARHVVDKLKQLGFIDFEITTGYPPEGMK